MRVRHLIEVRVLCDNGQSVCDGGGGNQGIGKTHGAVHARPAAVVDKVRPRCHHRLAHRKRIGLPRKGNGVGTTGPNVAVLCGQHSELQLPESDDRNRHAIR